MFVLPVEMKLGKNSSISVNYSRIVSRGVSSILFPLLTLVAEFL